MKAAGLVAVTSTAWWLWASFMFMIGVGAVHHWIPAVPTIGWVDATMVVLTVYCLGVLHSIAVTVPD